MTQQSRIALFLRCRRESHDTVRYRRLVALYDGLQAFIAEAFGIEDTLLGRRS